MKKIKLLSLIGIVTLSLGALSFGIGASIYSSKQGEQGIQGETGNGISSIEKTSSEGLVDTYTITFTDGTSTTFTVINGEKGAQGIQGIQGVPGTDGHAPVITIQNGFWYIDGVNTEILAEGIQGEIGKGISSIVKTSSEGLIDIYTITFTDGSTSVFKVTNGKDGEQGVPGDAGKGISSIEKTSSEGLVDTYTITYTDGDKTTFTVINGKNGEKGEQGIQGIQGEPGKDGHTPVITIQDGNWYIDGEDSGVSAEGIQGKTGNGISFIEKTLSEGLIDTYTITFTDGSTTTYTVINGKDGRGIVSITLQSSEGLVDTYEIVYSDDTTSMFTVTNGKDGANGEQGIQGIQGEPGKDGHTPVITIQEGNWYIDGEDTGISAQGVKGDTGNGISAILKTGSDGLVDTYTITFTDGSTSTFTVTNGKDGENGEQGIQGIQGEPGKDGHTPVITIQGGNWHIDGEDTGISAEGVQGPQGEPGKDGIGITSIILASSSGLIDTYAITYTDGSTSTFTVTNGKDGANGAQGIQGIQGEPGKDGHTPVITIQEGNWYIDGEDTGISAQGVKGDTGNGISAILKTGSDGLVDTYTITFTDGSTSTFTVTNGKDGENGEQGIQGIQGEPGKDGHTPVITIQGGNWYIDGVDTGVKAEGIQGPQGEPGQDGIGIVSITLASSSGLIDTYTITYTDGSTSTFTVTNGKDGANGEQGIQGIQGKPGKDGHTPVITIQGGNWYIDGEDTGVLAEGIQGDPGNGISFVEKTSSDGLEDTYTITFTDGSTTTFTVTNGKDGITPEFKIEAGFVYISYNNGISWDCIGNLNGQINEFEYVVLDDSTVTIVGYNGYSKDIVIPSTITHENKIYDVVSIECGAFYLRTDLTSITIPDSIETIGDFAFYYCSNIKELVIPSSVKYIGVNVLTGCYKLESLTVPFVGAEYTGTTTSTSLGYLFGNVFYYSSQSITVDAKTYYIPKELTYLEVTNSEVIPANAFSSFTKLEEIVLSCDVKKISNGAFANCKNLKSIILPNTVETIAGGSFTGCSSLESITLPFVGYQNKSSTETYQYPLGYIFGESSYDGAISVSQTYIGSSTSTKTTSTYYIPASLNSVTITCGNINSGAFQNCRNITDIVIEDGPNKLHEKAFDGCTSLVNITIPSSVVSFEDNVFVSNVENIYYVGTIGDWCGISFGTAARNPMYYAEHIYMLNDSNILEEVEKIIVPNSVTKIGPYQFYNFNSATEIMLPENITSIGSYAFYNCTKLTDITIPNSTTTIGSSAFSGCNTLESITLPFVGYQNKSATASYQYPFGYIFGTTSYESGVKTAQTYYGSSSSTTTTAEYYIPKSLKEVTITTGNINYGAFQNCESIETVRVLGEITSIEANAFKGCKNLINLELSNSITTLGEYAFYDCKNLIDFELPSSLVNVGSYAFKSCEKLKNVEIPNGVASIGSAPFAGCSGLESITLPFVGSSISASQPFGYIFGVAAYNGCEATQVDSTTYYIPKTLKSVVVNGGNIGYNAFYNCINLNSIILPENCQTIGSNAFRNCDGLTSIEIPDTVTKIGASAFLSCDGITKIVVPNSVTSIGDSAFENCSNLIEIKLPETLTSINSKLFNNCNSLTEIEIPDTVTAIGTSAFANCTSLTSVDIPNDVTTLGTSAFSGCSSLTNINLSEDLTSIGSSTFANCTNLTSIDIPDTVTTIGTSAFANCTSLTSVDLPSNLTNIENYTFNNCSSLESIELPSVLTTIGTSAFANCIKLSNVNLSNSSIKTIGESAFLNCTQFKEIVIPNTVTSIGIGAFSGCGNLESITVPFIGGTQKSSSDSYQYPFGYIFGTTSFDGAESVSQTYYGTNSYNTTSTTYYIPTSLKEVTVLKGYINYGAFYNCKNIEHVILESSTGIGQRAFYNCSSLSDIELPNTLNSISTYAFYNCDGLTEIIVPTSVTSIGEGAFSGCGNLESITIPFVGYQNKSSTSTGQYPFGYIFGTSSYDGAESVSQSYYGNSTTSTTSTTYYIPKSLKEVTISRGYINYGAFFNCTMLESITILGNITYIGDRAFYGCSSLTNIEIPDTVTMIGDYAFYNCTSLMAVTIPSSATTIDAFAFGNCKSLTNVVIPDTVTSIGSNIFSGCETLESITIPFVGNSQKTSTSTYQYPLGYLFGSSSYNGSEKTVQTYYGSSTTTPTSNTYYIPISLKEVIVTKGNINYGAFSDCGNLETIVIPDTVTTIGDYAFYDCTNLTNFDIPDTVTTIGDYAFYKCINLTGVILPDTVTTIESYAFYMCKKLIGMEIPESVITIGKDALLFEGGPYEVILETTYDNYIWTRNGEIYTSSNKGVNSSTSSICVEFNTAGTFTFSYMSYGESSYDYLIVEKNGEAVFDCKGKASSTFYSYSIDVEEGDEIRFYYKKDSSQNANSDYAQIKNLAFVASASA